MHDFWLKIQFGVIFAGVNVTFFRISWDTSAVSVEMYFKDVNIVEHQKDENEKRK